MKTNIIQAILRIQQEFPRKEVIYIKRQELYEDIYDYKLSDGDSGSYSVFSNTFNYNNI